MVNFICNRCSKSFSTKQGLNRHNNRKFTCIGVEKKNNKKELSKRVIQSYPKLSKVILKQKIKNEEKKVVKNTKNN